MKFVIIFLCAQTTQTLAKWKLHTCKWLWREFIKFNTYMPKGLWYHCEVPVQYTCTIHCRPVQKPLFKIKFALHLQVYLIIWQRSSAFVNEAETGREKITRTLLLNFTFPKYDHPENTAHTTHTLLSGFITQLMLLCLMNKSCIGIVTLFGWEAKHQKLLYKYCICWPLEVESWCLQATIAM